MTRHGKLEEVLTAEPRDKTKANAAIRLLFSKVVVDWNTGDLNFHWKHAPDEVIRRNRRSNLVPPADYEAISRPPPGAASRTNRRPPQRASRVLEW